MIERKPIPFQITSRYKGMSDDPRIQDFDYFRICLNFDTFSNPKKATPYRNTEDDTTDTDYRITRGVYYGSKLYGLGRKSTANNFTKIYEKASNILTDAWTASTTGEDASGTPDYNSFLQYEGLLYFFANSTRIGAYEVATNTFTATALNLTSYTNSAQGLVTRDGLLLMPYDNKIAVKAAGGAVTAGWEAARLTLPSTLKVMDMEEWGDYVAIICAPVTQGNRNSMLYIWDKVSADVTDEADLGEGDAQLICNIDGELVAVMAVNDISASDFKTHLVTKVYLGGKSVQTLHDIETDGTTFSIQRTTKIKDQNRYKFGCKAVIDGDTYHCLWTLGRKKISYPIVLSMDRLINNDTALTSLEGAWKVGSYYWFSINSGTIKRTNNDAAYTATSIYISQKFTAPSHNLSIKWAGVTCPPLPAGSTLSLYYRVNEETAWTKIFDYSTTNGMGKQAGTESDGTDFSNFSECQFKLTSVGGTALPTEWLTIEGEFQVLDAEMTD